MKRCPVSEQIANNADDNQRGVCKCGRDLDVVYDGYDYEFECASCDRGEEDEQE